MSRGTLIILISIGCIAVGTAWILKSAAMLRQSSTKATPQTPVSSLKSNMRAPAPVNPVQSNQSINLQRNTAVLNQLQLEQEKLVLQKQKLDSLLLRHIQYRNQLNTTYPNMIMNSQIEIQNLTDTLEAERHQEILLERSAVAIADTAFRNLQSVQMQLQPKVQPLLMSRELTLNRIDIVKSDPYVTPTQKAASIEELQQSLNNLNEQLENLNLQNQSAVANAAQVDAQASQTILRQKFTAKEDQAEMLQNIFFLRSEIARLQNEERQTQLDLRAMSSEIEESKLIYQEQMNKVKSVESEIR